MSGSLIDTRLALSAERHPAGPAVIDRSRRLTYVELEARANRVAQLLRDCGVRRGDRVGLYLEKSVEAVVAVYGILRASAAYVPLDPAAPVTRLASIARDADLRVVVTGAEQADLWRGFVESGAPIDTLLVLGEDNRELERPENVTLLTEAALESYSGDRAPGGQRSEDDLAYVLYTSGSTGMPKGVMLSHLNALSFVDWGVDEFEIIETDVLSSHAPFHFDLSIFDLYAALTATAAVALVPPEVALFPVALARWIRDAGISVWYSVPSALTALAVRGKLGGKPTPSLRTILFAGEVFPTKFLRLLMEQLPRVRLANLYGPTETNVCTWYEVPRGATGPPDPLPIGKPITGVDVFAITDEGRTAEAGEVGELYVRGPTVMHGYWNDSERTSRTLIQETAPDGTQHRVYKTGDLARLDERGDWIFLGRRDAQIKSRGYRIELGEIEAALNQHAAVVECAVVAIPDELLTNRIKVYAVVQREVDQAELVVHCRERIPHYMVPELFEFTEALPRTSTGKIDRNALSVDARELPREGPRASTTTKGEEKACRPRVKSRISSSKISAGPDRAKS
jgi:amino acid adenylation domain-containing protein